MITRACVSTTCSDHYRSKCEFNNQYAGIYFSRINQLRQPVERVAHKRWQVDFTSSSRDIQPLQATWIVGVIFREMSSKPNIIKDLDKIYHGVNPEHASHYYGDNDAIFLEDSFGRIPLSSENASLFKLNILVTGIVIAILGAENSEGVFVVEDICYPGIPPQPPLPDMEKPKYVAFVCGLLVDDTEAEPPNICILADYLSGQFGDPRVPHIAQLVIAGNSLKSLTTYEAGSRVDKPKTEAEGLRVLDRLLELLSSSLPVHLMPGEQDPATVAIPQQPMIKGLFRRNRERLNRGGLCLDTNPQKFNFDGVKVLGTSGQPIDDLRRYTEISALDAMHSTLKWRHIAPTAPDTLCTYPFTEQEPFVLDESPHVYFAGNQEAYSTDYRDNVRFITIPVFRTSGIIVLLDLSTLEPSVVKLNL